MAETAVLEERAAAPAFRERGTDAAGATIAGTHRAGSPNGADVADPAGVARGTGGLTGADVANAPARPLDARQRYRAKASVRKVEPGVEALLFHARPIAVWVQAEERVYLLYGWDAFSATAACARAFVAEKMHAELRGAADLRRMVRENTLVVDCSFLNGAGRRETDLLFRLRDAWRKRTAEAAAHDVAQTGDAEGEPAGAARADPPQHPPRVSLTVFLEEWLGDAADPRSDVVAYPDFNAVTVNGLLKLEGILDEHGLPTEKGRRFGLEPARWEKADGSTSLYALYPRENSEMYRDLVFRLYMESKGDW